MAFYLNIIGPCVVGWHWLQGSPRVPASSSYSSATPASGGKEPNRGQLQPDLYNTYVLSHSQMWIK